MTSETQAIVSLTAVSISAVALCVSLVALAFIIRNYLRKSGISLKGGYSVTMGGDSESAYVSSIAIENAKDRPVVIFGIFLRAGKNWYLEIEGFEEEPLVLSPYEIYTKSYDPVDIYCLNMSKIILDDVLNNKDMKKNICLSTPDGKYTITKGLSKWHPRYDSLKNYTTAPIMPLRLVHHDKSYGSNAKYIVELNFTNSDKQVIPVYRDEYRYSRYKNLTFTEKSLESKESLENHLSENIKLNEIECVGFSVFDVDKAREEEFSDISDVLDVMVLGWFKYNVIGMLITWREQMYISFINWKSRVVRPRVNKLKSFISRVLTRR